MPDFYRDYEFFKCKDNGYVTSEKRMCHYESCGNDQKAVAADVPCGRIVYRLLLSVLLVTTGTLLIGGIGWYMKTKISYFVFYYPLKEMIGILLLLLAVSMVTPGILYRRVLVKNK